MASSTESLVASGSHAADFERDSDEQAVTASNEPLLELPDGDSEDVRVDAPTVSGRQRV